MIEKLFRRLPYGRQSRLAQFRTTLIILSYKVSFTFIRSSLSTLLKSRSTDSDQFRGFVELQLQRRRDSDILYTVPVQLCLELQSPTSFNVSTVTQNQRQCLRDRHDIPISIICRDVTLQCPPPRSLNSPARTKPNCSKPLKIQGSKGPNISTVTGQPGIRLYRYDAPWMYQSLLGLPYLGSSEALNCDMDGRRWH